MTDFEILVRQNYRFGRMCRSHTPIDSARCIHYNN